MNTKFIKYIIEFDQNNHTLKYLLQDLKLCFELKQKCCIGNLELKNSQINLRFNCFSFYSITHMHFFNKRE